MKKLSGPKFLLLSLCAFSLSSLSRGGTIDYSGYDAQFVSGTGPSSYEQLSVGSYVSLGTFDLGGSFNFNLIGTPSFDSWASISPFYTEYGNTEIFSEDGFGVFFGNAITLGLEGVALYIVGFDTPDPLDSQKMAIVGGGSGWVGPSDTPPGDATAIDIGVGAPTVFFGNLTDIQGYGGMGEGYDVSLSTVPEPSTVVLAVGSLGVLFIGCAVRRFKK